MSLEDAGVDELFALARASEDPDAYWACIAEIRARGGDRAFKLAEVLCESILAGERCLGADVLGQLGGSRSAPALRRLLEEDEHPAVLAAAAAGSGFIGDELAADRLSELISHPEEGVRFAAVTALMRIDDERGVVALVELAAQPDGQLSSWAGSALEQLRGA